MRLTIAGLMAAVMLAGCGAKPEPRVEDAWVRLPAVAGRPGAAYFTLQAGPRPLTLVAVRTPSALRAELHESMTGGGGMMAMAPLKQAGVAANGALAFAPGGRHVMLFDIDPALKPGDATTLTLAFADGATIETKATARGAGDPAP